MAKIVCAFALLTIFAIVIAPSAARPETQSAKQQRAEVETLESGNSDDKDLKGAESIGYGYYGGVYPGYVGGYGYSSYPSYGYSSYYGGGYPYYGYRGGFGGLYNGYYW